MGPKLLAFAWRRSRLGVRRRRPRRRTRLTFRWAWLFGLGMRRRRQSRRRIQALHCLWRSPCSEIGRRRRRQQVPGEPPALSWTPLVLFLEEFVQGVVQREGVGAAASALEALALELQLAWPAAWVAPRVDTKAVEEMVVSAAIQVQPGAARPMGAVGASCVQAVAAAEPAGEGPSLTVVRQACMRTLRVQERAAFLAVARRDVHGACMPRRLRFEQQQHHQQHHNSGKSYSNINSSNSNKNSSNNSNSCSSSSRRLGGATFWQNDIT